MVIIKLSSIRRHHRVLMVLLLLIFCSLPFQHRINGIFKSFSKSLIPSDLPIPGFFSKSVYFYVTDPILLLFVGCLFFYFRPSWRSFFWQGPSKLLSLLFFTALVSIILSKAAHYPLQYIRLAQFSLGILLFNAIVSLRQRLDFSSLITSFAWALLGVGLFEGALAIGQYFTQSSLGVAFLGEMRLTHFSFPAEEGALYLGGSPIGAAFLCRASGSFSHPNILGAFLVCSLLSTCYLYLNNQNRRSRLLLLLALSIQVLALLTSFSRAGLLSFGVAFALFCWILFKQRSAILGLFLTTLSFFVAGMIFLSPALLSRGGIFNYNGTVQGADLERIQYSKMAVEMIKENPFFGVGFNNFQLYSPAIQESMSGPVLHSKVHNIYLLMASETGLIGGGLFVLFLLSILSTAFKKLLSPSRILLERAYLVAAFVGLLLMGCFDFFLVNISAASLLFFAIAALLYGISLKIVAKR